jgi:hypothetical protein
MKLVVSVLGLTLVLFAGPACGGDDDDDGVDANPAGVDSGVGGVDAGPGADAAAATWTSLITGTWTLAAGTEKYHCAKRTVAEDTYIRGFRGVAPLGTHHTVVTIQAPDGPDGEFPCSPGTISDQMLFASGVGTDDLIFPAGVAVKVPGGMQVGLNLHLFNVGEATINGTSGTDIWVVPASEVTAEAEMMFAGTFSVVLPAGQETTLQGDCLFAKDATVVTVWPHMHQLGTHMKVEHVGAATATVHDEPYSFYEQVNYPITPLVVKAGESIRVHCTYNNTTGTTVYFGDSSEDEMCFSGLYRYPAANDGLFCAEGPF